MKKLVLFVIFILLVITVVGCKSDVIDSSIYNGNNLIIGIIGETPVVREENIKFKDITFEYLEETKNLSSEINAVFIMKENLEEASKSKYVEIYKNSGIPFFFIECEKSHIPFTSADLLYGEVDNLSEDIYAIGILMDGEKVQYWGFGLYNDRKNEQNIKDVYTRIFNTIESIRSKKY